MTTSLPPMTRRLLDASTYAVLATVNMARDPRVSLCLYDPADPFQYVEVRSTVDMVEEGGDD
jgi:hypothetical protein